MDFHLRQRWHHQFPARHQTLTQLALQSQLPLLPLMLLHLPVLHNQPLEALLSVPSLEQLLVLCSSLLLSLLLPCSSSRGERTRKQLPPLPPAFLLTMVHTIIRYLLLPIPLIPLPLVHIPL